MRRAGGLSFSTAVKISQPQPPECPGEVFVLGKVDDGGVIRLAGTEKRVTIQAPAALIELPEHSFQTLVQRF